MFCHLFHAFPIAISWQFLARQDELAEEQQTGEAAWSEIFTTPFFRTLSEAVAVVVAGCNGDLPRIIGDFMGYDYHMTRTNCDSVRFNGIQLEKTMFELDLMGIHQETWVSGT